MITASLQAMLATARSPVAHAPAWLWLVAAALLLVCAIPVWRAHPLERRAAGTRAAATLTASWALLWLAAGPRVPTQLQLPTRQAALVLLDDSCSMQRPVAANAASRWDHLQRLMAAGQPKLRQLQANVDVVLARLSELDAEPQASAADSSPPCAPRTRIAQALQALAARTALPVAAALVISDGSDEAMAQEVPAASGEAAPAQSDLQGGAPTTTALPSKSQQASMASAALAPTPFNASPAASAPFPVDTISVGAPLPDLAVVQIRAPSFAFVKTQVPIDVDVVSTALSTRAQTVTVWDGSVAIAQKTLTVAASRRTTVPFTLRFEDVASKSLLATIDRHPDELVLDNNERAIHLRVLRDKLRILHVLGRPSFDGRAVREALLAAKNVDVVSFYILRSPDSDTSVAQHELSLIPFPVNQLFTSELKNFDVVILQQFDPRPFGMQGYVDNLARAVNEGMGLIVVGEPSQLRAQGWLDTPLAQVLPIEVAPSSARRLGPGPMQAVTLAQGMKNSPFGQALRALPQRSGRDGGSLQPAIAAHAGAGAAAKAGANVVLETNFPGSAPQPVVVVGPAGRGHAAALLTDSSWQWAFAAPLAGGAQGPALLQQLWGQLLAAVTEEPADAVYVRPFSMEAVAGVRLEGVAGDTAASASPAVALRAQCLPSPAATSLLGSANTSLPQLGALGAEAPSPQSAGAVALALHEPHHEAGFWMQAPRPGRVLLQAERSSHALAGRAGASEVAIAVLPSSEMAAVQPEPAYLAALSQQSGGRSVSSVAEFAAVVRASPRAPAGASLVVPRPLWPRPWAVAATFALLVGHFWLARRVDF